MVVYAAAAHAGKFHVASGPVLRADSAPQKLSTALEEFTLQTGLQYGSHVVAEQQSRGAHAKATPAQALKQLLRCTGLRFEFGTERSVNILAGGRPATDDPECTPPDALPVIVVPYTRTREPVDKVPINLVVIPAINADSWGTKGLAGVAALTPGVEFDFLSSVGASVYTNLAIRGISDRHGSTSGIFVDDVPIPHARPNTLGRAYPAQFDLESFEVMRGPQGSLLGADTQGGAIRFNTAQPSLVDKTSTLHADMSTTDGANGSYELGAAAGGPIVENKLGYRVSAWGRSEGGFVDRVDPTPENEGKMVEANSNDETIISLRGALKYVPAATDRLTISPAIDYESNETRDSRSFMPYLSDLGRGHRYNGSLIPQSLHDEFYLPSLRIDYQLAKQELVSTSAYFDRYASLMIDDTQSEKWGFKDADGNVTAYPDSYDDLVSTTVNLRQRMIFQQLQLQPSRPEDRLQWFGGIAYVQENYRESDHLDVSHFPRMGDLPYERSDTTTTVQKRLAVYGQVDRVLATHFKATAGLRVEHAEYASDAVGDDPFHARHAETLTAPKFLLAYEPADRGLYYLSATKGYSPAGVDAALPTCFSPPQAYPSDSVWSYELGAKQFALGKRMHLDAALFHSTWSNGSQVWTNCLYTHLPGPAVSNGVDFDLKSTWKHATASLWVTYTDAHYTRTIVQEDKVIVRAGDALGTPPLVISPWNLTTSYERWYRLNDGDDRVTFRVEDIYHSRNPGPFYSSDPDSFRPAPGLAPDPAINILNLRGTMKRGRFELAAYINNVTNEQPTLLKRNKGNDLNSLYFATKFRPRTAGLSTTMRY